MEIDGDTSDQVRPEPAGEPADEPAAAKKPRKPRQKPQQDVRVDGDWFKKQLERSGKSQNSLARHLGIAGSQASRLFTGQRKMKFEEVHMIARFIGASPEDVLIHAGLALTSNIGSMTASQFVGVDGRLTPAGDPVELSPALAIRAREAVPFDQHINAALIRAPKGVLAIWDDALVLYEDIGSKPPEMGVLSIARLRDGVTMMGRIQSVKKTGEARIEGADGQSVTVVIDAASKVLAVIP